MREALTQVESNIYFLDSRKVNGFGVSGVYLIAGDGLTLIETGTTLVAPYILEAVHEIGYKNADIKRAIVTHIHLDHAGGTGWLTRRLPDMKVYVHERGLKHLNDPSTLIDSAKMVYGDLNTIHEIHGEIFPVPGENLVPVSNMELDIGGGLRLELFDAPGHAPHHIGIFESETGCLFSGEALGHHHPEARSIQPAVAPPGFNYESSKATIKKIRDLNPRTICFSQFGPCSDASFAIQKAEQQLQTYYAFILNRFKKGLSVQEVIQDILRQHAGSHPEKAFLNNEMLVSIVAGYQTYFKRSGRLT